MARSASRDPIDKFRFQVTFLENSTLRTGGRTSTIAKTITEMKRAGFSEATIPKAITSEISYRENTDSNLTMKIPALSNYEPITLRRGAYTDFDLYEWYLRVNDDSSSMNRYTETLAGLSAVPYQDSEFRKDIILSSLDRAGNYNKHWILFNAFPISYKGGDDFNANASEKLIEEITITYECFMEVEGKTIDEALANAQRKTEIATKKAIESALIGLL